VIHVSSVAACARILAAAGVFIGAAEYLAIRSEFRGSGIFSGRIHVLNFLRVPRHLKGLHRAIHSYGGAMAGHSVGMGLALLLFVPLDMRVYSLILLSLFLIQLQAFYQNGFGCDRSDQMLLLMVAALGVAYAFQLKGPGAWIALWFIAAQAVLSYATAGISKLISPVWRSGRSLILIFNTASYGSREVSRWLTRVPTLGFAGSWMVIIFECAMPLALVAPKRIMISMLVIAGVFHVGCAMTMGLNGFVWAFLSTFPVLYLCNVDRASAVSGVQGTHGDKLAVLAGGAFALAVVAAVLIRYYDLFGPFTGRDRHVECDLGPSSPRSL
jgi:hypothetical protein